MALWGNKDNITATGRVTLDYQTGIVTGSNLEDIGNGTQFGETGEIQAGDIIRFGVINKPGVYMGDAVVVSIAGTTSLTIGSTMGLDGVAIARTTFTVTQAPKSTVLDRSFSEDDNINDGAPSIVNERRFIAQAGVSTTGAGTSIISLRPHHRDHPTAGIKAGDFIENQGNNIKIIGVGTAEFHANFPSGVGSDRVYIDGTIPGLDSNSGVFIDNALYIPQSIGGTFFTISPVLASAVSTNEIIQMDTRVDAVRGRDHHFVVGLAGSITAEISAGDSVQIKRQKGGYARNVYGISTTGTQNAASGVYEVGTGWVGVTTYVDTEGNLRVKKEILVAMSGIATGNAPVYPSIEHAN
jgi:hypothetical protein